MKFRWVNFLRDRSVVGYVLIGLLALAGCSVSPWERGNLAREEMLPNPDPALSAMRAHVFESKEASSGGQGGVGGGCGCN